MGQKIWLTENFHEDLRWFNKFLTNYNGKVVMDISQPSMGVFVDAFLDGVGAKWNENVYASDYPNKCCNSLTIVHFEMELDLGQLQLINYRINFVAVEVNLGNRAASLQNYLSVFRHFAKVYEFNPSFLYNKKLYLFIKSVSMNATD